MARPETARAQLLAIGVALLVFVVVQVALAGTSDSGPRTTASANVAKQIKRLKQRVAAVEAKVGKLAKPVQVPATLPPSGPAGGDLTGSYPAPSLRAPEALIEAGLPDGSPGACPPGNVWADVSPDVNNPVGYYRDRSGIVHLQGLAMYCGSLGDIFTLPAGYRPAKQENLGAVTANNAATQIQINPSSGSVDRSSVAPSIGSTVWIDLDGLSFRCGPSGQNGCP